jgi:serine/threonine-protein kinase
MGEVYRAHDAVLDRTVAVKVLDERFAADDEIRRRFRREGQAGARLSGLPFTVMTFDVGEWQGRPFIVMEYLGGGTLADVIREGPPPAERALTWLEQAALSLDAAHAVGVVHRDVKPGNLLLDEHGELHVADFGIATAVGLDSFTQTGTILGTAGYLSPEQAEGKSATAASDRYALGVVAFELLTGSRPFAGDSVAAEVAGHAYGEVPSASARRRSVPAAADPVFRSSLEKRPDRRYPRCTAFVAALRSAYAGAGLAAAVPALPASELPTVVGRRAPRRRAGWWVVALVALAVVAVVVAGLSSGGDSSFPPAANGERATAPHGAPPGGPASRGERLARAGRLTAAVPVLELAVKRLGGSTGPRAASANLVLGQTLVALHRCQAAVPYLTRAVTLSPGSEAASTSLATARSCAAAPQAPAPKPVHDHPRPHPKPPKPPKHDHGHHGHGPGHGEGD